MIRSPIPIAVASALLVAAASAAAQTDARALRTRTLAAQCAQCHGTDGRAPGGSPAPALAGQSAEYLVAQMTAFKSGARAGSVMPQLAKGFSDAQIAELGAWFEKAPR